MAVEYIAVQWNRQKRIYDLVLVGGVGAYLILFAVLSKVLFPLITDEIMLMRAFGSAAFLLLHIILCIGPLCRLDKRFLPLLYNRRHAGVTMFLLALVHALLVVLTYHAGGNVNPIVSIFLSTPIHGPFAAAPFQALGFFALVILFLMAATSHDFWLANLSAPVWKSLHMMVYLAYALLIGHVAFGILQAETSSIYVGLVAVGFITVLSLHLIAGFREAPTDRDLGTIDATCSGRGLTGVTNKVTETRDEFLDTCSVAEIRENRARIVCVGGERVAIFKYAGKISAVSNVCQHQNGPLGEGKIVDGCITCPWHGYQYVPETGTSPPPFTEKVPTFNVRVKDGRVWINQRPNAPGTRAEPALIETEPQRPLLAELAKGL